MAKLTAKLVRELIDRHRGNVAAVARSCGVTRAPVHRFIHQRPDLAAALQEARETILDDAEDALTAAVLRGEPWAVCFFLKTQGKGRGYTQRQELTGKDGEPIAAKPTPRISLEEFKRLPFEERVRMLNEEIRRG